MTRASTLGSIAQLWRYYQAGIINTLFGYGMYALLVTVGLNMYVAQAVAHVLGVVFNYFTYSRYAFPDAKASKVRFMIAYGVHYLLGLACLAGTAQLIASPYVAGGVAVIFVTLINYFILKNFVFLDKLHE